MDHSVIAKSPHSVINADADTIALANRYFSDRQLDKIFQVIFGTEYASTSD